MSSVRVVALLLVIATTGPSAGALICDWACATTHEQASSSDCHGQDGPGSSAAIAAIDPCHELAAVVEGVFSGVSQAEPRVLAESAATLPDPVVSSPLLIAVRSSGPPHTPPPLRLPLRI